MTRGRRRMARAALLLGVTSLPMLAGCGSILQSREPVPIVYVFSAPRADAAAAGASANSRGAVSAVSAAGAGTGTESDAASAPATSTSGVSLQVLRSLPRPGYSSDRIVLLRGDRRLDIFADSRWAAELPAVVSAAAVDHARAYGGFRSVHDDNTPFAADYTLRMTIRRFDADYAGAREPSANSEAPSAEVAFDVLVGRRADRVVLASFAASASQRAQANRMSEIVAAFDAALADALREVVERTRSAVEADRLRTSTAQSPP